MGLRRCPDERDLSIVNRHLYDVAKVGKVKSAT